MSGNQPRLRHTLFPTPIGVCGIAWGEYGILALQLPEATESATRARLLRRCGASRSCDAADGGGSEPPPAAIGRVLRDIVALLEGQARSLEHAELDMRALPSFHRLVYQQARGIAPGQTCSYAELARRCGEPDAARAVGQALGLNPYPIIVPCHRVLAAGGRSGGFSARGGLRTKLRLLSLEGAACAQLRPSPTPEQPNLALPF